MSGCRGLGLGLKVCAYGGVVVDMRECERVCVGVEVCGYVCQYM